MGLATADVLVHGWDLARAIGADDTMPAAAVEAVHMGLSQATAEMIRNPQVFGDRRATICRHLRVVFQTLP